MSFCLPYFLMTWGSATDFFIQSTIPTQSAWGTGHPESSSDSGNGSVCGERRLPCVWQAFIVLQCSASSSLMFMNTSYRLSKQKTWVQSDLYCLKWFTKGNAAAFLLRINIVLLMCVLPIFGLRVLGSREVWNSSDAITKWFRLLYQMDTWSKSVFKDHCNTHQTSTSHLPCSSSRQSLVRAISSIPLQKH